MSRASTLERAVLPPADPQRGERGLVTLVIPAKDEEDGIGDTLRGLPLATLEAQGFGREVLVLDGRSRDRTREIARAWGAQVFVQSRPGKGNAVREARGRMRGDYIVMLDADATYAIDAIPVVLEVLASGEADVVMGSRFRGWAEPGAMPAMNRVGNALLSAAASVLFLRPCTDVCTGLWGFRGPVLRSLPLRAEGFDLEVELFGLCVRQGLRVREVPVDYLARRGATKLRPLQDGLSIGRGMLRARFAAAEEPVWAPASAEARRGGESA